MRKPLNHKRCTHIAIILIVGMMLPSNVLAQDVSLSGVDSRFTAVTGEVDIYTVVTGTDGRTLTQFKAEDFILRDSVEGGDWSEGLEITGFSSAGEPRDGIAFLVLIDDSASMYLNTAGEATDDWDNTRAAMARREARRFIEDLGSSMDRAGLADFGTSYQLLATPRTDRITVVDHTSESPVPDTLEAYTELYASISEAADTMKTQKGRRIIILFSDGVNFPFAGKRGEAHPEYGMRQWTPDDSLSALREEAVSLYAVRFGPDRDSSLADIALSTGGLVFDVEEEKELDGLYGAIRERVLSEYRLSYRPRPSGADTTRVSLSLILGNSAGEISYRSGFVFGKPADSSQVWLSLLAIPIAVIAILLLVKMAAGEKASVPSLGRLRPQAGDVTLVALNDGKTVISPGPAGGSTVIAAAGKDSAASGKGTIIVEKGKDGRWRISAGEGVSVNNRKVESTILEDGDVIRAGEELIVFDDGQN